MPSPADCGELAAYFDTTEHARVEVETKWGVGRAERLAPPDLLARFRRQQVTWREAYAEAWDAPFMTRNLLEAVAGKAGSMCRAWAALDAAAEEAGHRAVAPWVWEVPLSNGTIAALVQTDAEASKVIAEGRFLVVYTAAEIGHVIDALPDALKLAKQVWPGAKVQRPTVVRNDLGVPPWSDEGDEIPFGDPAPQTLEEGVA